MGILDNVGAKVKPPLFGEFLAEDELFSTEFPAIFELLSRVMVKGVERLPSKLLLYYQEGCCALCLTDPHTGSVGWHISKTYAEAMESLESRLQHGEMDWRISKPKK
jgi:hypothetical protein